MERFFGFEDAADIVRNFEAPDDALKDAVVIAAVYEGGWEGSAMVVFRKEGRLYEVHGSHCSCNGLEGQWSPEETTYEALTDRLDKTADYQIERFGNEFATALRKGLVDEMFDREVLEN